MDAKIIHRVGDTITAYIDGEKVKICYDECGIYAASDDEAIRIGNSYLNTESGSVTQGERFVGNILSKQPTEWYIARGNVETPRPHKSTICAHNRRK